MRILLGMMAMFMICTPQAQAAEMSVAQAYKAQRHQQTTFNKDTAQMSAAESKYLDHLFFVTDMAFRERMVMLQYFYKKKDDQYIDQYNKQIGELLASFALVKAPGRSLPTVEKLVREAITEQQQFFNSWHKARGTEMYNSLSRGYTSHKLVQSSHKKLIQSYGVLMKAYPREAAHNKQAFYDHLCALDFI